MSDKNSVKIKIYGKEYNLKGPSDAAYMQQLAQAVDEKMREIAAPNTANELRTAMLAAVNIADELYKARRALDNERQRFDRAARTAAGLDLRLQAVLHEREKSEEAARSIILEEAEPELLAESQDIKDE